MAPRWVRVVTALVALVALAWPGASLAVAATHSASATSTSQPTATAATTSPLSGGVSPISPLPSATTTTSAQSSAAANTTTTAGASSLSTGDAFAIAIGAIALLGGISYFIWRDARRRAPVRGRGLDGGMPGDGRRAGSKPPPKPRKLSPAERKRRKRGRAGR